jgi:peptidoglycan-associated lipoprotein
MHTARSTQAALAAVLALTSAGCATKGFVREEVGREVSSARAAQTESLAAEAAARRTADTELEARLQQRIETRIAEQMAVLRQDLTQLRSDFGVRISAMEDTLKFVTPVHFAYDDATVRAADQPVLEKIAAVLQRHYPGAAITIEGFADPAGSSRYNSELSQRRADAVRTALESYGLGGPTVNAVGYGETRLIVPGAWGDAPGAEMNRRVVFVVVTRGSPLNVMTMQDGTGSSH